MGFHFDPALCCPLDQAALSEIDGTLGCQHRHRFDIARKGYVNLLGAQHKRSRDPGDSRAMVEARRLFLEAGHYRNVADALVDRLRPELTGGARVVDAGCGEGYYLQRLREGLPRTSAQHVRYVGFDISKWAVQAAARRFPATWLVATNRRVPLADASADIVMDLFGFADFGEFARILTPQGTLVRVQAGERHLHELRQLIYREPRAQASEHLTPDGFRLVDRFTVDYQIDAMQREAVAALLLMTPHLFRASTEGKAAVAAVTSLDLTVQVVISIFHKA